MPYKDYQRKLEHQREYGRIHSVIYSQQNKDRYFSRRDNWIDENGPCQYCGSWENLEVDHIDRDEKDESHIFFLSSVRREPELLKCQVLCNFCHKSKTREEHISKRQHGTYSMYVNGKCRCSFCKEANLEYKRDLYRRQKLV